MSQYKMFKAISNFLETVPELKDNKWYEFKIEFVRKPDGSFHFSTSCQPNHVYSIEPESKP